MSKIVVRGAQVITPQEERLSDVWTGGQFIAGLGSLDNADGFDVIDGSGCYLTPGLIDLQVNGIPGCDFWGEISADRLDLLSRKMLEAGVTTILPTIITGSLDHLVKNREKLKALGAGVPDSTSGRVRMPGIHFEGPCLSPERPGVHPKEHIRPLSMDAAEKLSAECVKLITVAPETDVEGKVIEFLAENGITVALGHSNATYEEAETAFARGIRMMTHTFNALPGIHHRKPGAVTAALLDDRVSCCVICDGLHLAPPAVGLVLKCKSPERTILVTDVAAIGTSGGDLVGSSILMIDAVQNLVKWGFSSFREAILMSTLNPAKAANLDERIGHLSPGAFADMVLWEKDTLKIKSVIFNGRVEHRA